MSDQRAASSAERLSDIAKKFKCRAVAQVEEIQDVDLQIPQRGFSENLLFLFHAELLDGYGLQSGGILQLLRLVKAAFTEARYCTPSSLYLTASLGHPSHTRHWQGPLQKKRNRLLTRSWHYTEPSGIANREKMETHLHSSDSLSKAETCSLGFCRPCL